jgi:putative hydroxymethylpyrimidine transport system substrate-binding protein
LEKIGSKRRVEMKKLLLLSFLSGILGSENLKKVTLMLDWFPNPDHVPIYVAYEKGYFREEGLDMTLQIPADPNDPLKLAAIGKVDFAVSYEPNVIMAKSRGIPVISIGILIAHPLNTLMFLTESGIKSPKDLAGKRIGYSVTGFETAILSSIAEEAGLKLEDLKLVNVNFNLTPSLLSGQVDAVIGAYRNYEKIQIELEGKEVGMIFPEEHGVPDYYELVLITGEDTAQKRMDMVKSFIRAIDRAINFTLENPEEAFKLFLSSNPDLDNELNRKAFYATLPYFSRNQTQERGKWEKFQDFLYNKGVIEKKTKVEKLFLNILEN